MNRPRPPLGNALASRELDFTSKNGSTERIVVSIGTPVRTADSDPWSCPYKIFGPSFERESRVCGEDSMQALLLTLQIIPTELHRLAKDHDGTFHLYGETDLGFPELPSTSSGVSNPERFRVALDKACGEINEAARMAPDLFGGEVLELVRRELGRLMEVIDSKVLVHLDQRQRK